MADKSPESKHPVSPLHERCDHPYICRVIEQVESARPREPEFIQAVEEILPSLEPVIVEHPEYEKARLLERLIEPERVIAFRVVWEDDEGDIQVNRGWRVQFNSALGPYKGGLRFHRTVNQSILKFLGFEQIFKNALTDLPIGAGKGGSDFNPKGKSDREVARFCRAFMTELYRHIGPDTDVPAGDIGVGSREIGHMTGMHRGLTGRIDGTFTGKGISFGGSHIRTEATGYGCVYFASNMLDTRGKSLEGKTCLVSGAGNVAQYTIEKLIELGAKVISVSDSGGFIHDPEGIDQSKLEFIKDLKDKRRGSIAEYAEKYKSAKFHEREADADDDDESKGSNSPRRVARGDPLWSLKADCAFPCATQNEVGDKDAEHLLKGGVMLICEGANMPCTAEAEARFVDEGILYGPSKAANAGGVAVSALEMAQNARRERWSRDEVESRLRSIMKDIHDRTLAAARKYDLGDNYLDGANIAGFQRVAEAMMAQGPV